MSTMALETIKDEQNVERVKNHLKSFLQNNPYFLALPKDEQLKLYKDMLASGVEAITSGRVARALAQQDGSDEMKPTRIQDLGEIAGGFLDQVNFPEFVEQLITGVYDSIVTSSIRQMNAYVEMYKELAKPLAAITREISNTDALGQVAADNPLRFSMMSNPQTGEDELFDNDTQMTLDQSNEEVQRMMYQAKLALAKERRLMLRETMLMGVQRLIVEKGTIRAGLIFDIAANEKYKARKSETDIKQTAKRGGWGVLGFAGGGDENRRTKITVSTKKLDTDARLAAKITGHVEVNFKSDVFNLNNFANLFADEGTKAFLEERKAQIAPQQPARAVGPPAQPGPAQPTRVQ